MARRRKNPTSLDRRPAHTSGLVLHGQYPGLVVVAASQHPLEPRPTPELLENKIAVQTAEIERLAGDNNRLATSHMILREELIAAEQEVQRLKAHMRSIQTESDIQIRVLFDKIAKMEADIRAREGVKEEFQQAYKEAQSLVTERKELILHIQKGTQELQKARVYAKNLPDMLAELDSLRKEHQTLRATFDYEKGSNIEQVEQMQVMEKKLFPMAREIERLRLEVVNAEKRAHVPNSYVAGYSNPDSLYPLPMQGRVPYIDGYGRIHAQKGVGSAGEGVVAYESGNGVAAYESGNGVAAYESGNGVAAENADAPAAGDAAQGGSS